MKSKNKDKKVKFSNFLKKNNFKFLNMKNFDSLELIRFATAFEKTFKKKINILQMRNQKIDFFLNKIK